jgi:hypothetical protein
LRLHGARLSPATEAALSRRRRGEARDKPKQRRGDSTAAPFEGDLYWAHVERACRGSRPRKWRRQGDIGALKGELKGDIGDLKGDIRDLKGSIGDLRAHISSVETSLIKWVVGTGIAGAGLAFAAARLVH